MEMGVGSGTRLLLWGSWLGTIRWHAVLVSRYGEMVARISALIDCRLDSYCLDFRALSKLCSHVNVHIGDKVASHAASVEEPVLVVMEVSDRVGLS